MELKGYLKYNFRPRDFSGDDTEICHMDIDAITQISNLYSTNQVYFSDKCFQVDIDWSNLVDAVIKSYDPESEYYATIDGHRHKILARINIQEDEVSAWGKLKIPITINLLDIDYNYDVILAVKKLLMDIFFVSNISVPGVFDLYYSKLIIESDEYEFKLSNFYFSQSLNSMIDGPIPLAITLVPISVKHWFDNLNVGGKLESEQSIERAIFSLLHICHLDADVSMVSWVFHALEALYGTKSGRGFNDIASKAIFLIEIPIGKQKRFKADLRKLNDLRSSFIHGGYRVNHPLNDEHDKEVYRLLEFGTLIIINSIQALAQRKWIEVSVQEVFVGVPQTYS
ncbi:hypothetical protein KW539_08500 [Vibrio fluvialis]|nr:hypothetical protein [Vibrio fluvialis]MBY8240067.1 hypothetical protein [Vibrio fluvialis]